jgi:hypothetical protein
MEVRTEYLSEPTAKLDEKVSRSSTMGQGNSCLSQSKNECLQDNIRSDNDTSQAFSGTRTNQIPSRPTKMVPSSILDMMKLRIENSSRGWLQSLCPEDNAIGSPCTGLMQREGGDISCPDLLFERLVEAGRLISKALWSSKKIQHVLKWLAHMLRHAILTLHQSSPAMRIIRMSNPVIGEYIGAMVSVLFAVLYLLVLLKIIVALGKVVKLMGQTLGLIWVPLRMILLALKWCFLS